MFFIVLKISYYFLRYDKFVVKVGHITDSLWEGETKTAKKDYFI